MSVTGRPLIKGDSCRVATKDGGVPWASNGAMLLPSLGLEDQGGMNSQNWRE